MSSRCIKASFYISENTTYFPITKGFKRKITMKLVYQYIAAFLNFSPTSSHFHSLQVENCDSNSRLVVDENDNGKVMLERVNVGPLSVNLAQHQTSIEPTSIYGRHHLQIQCWFNVGPVSKTVDQH